MILLDTDVMVDIRRGLAPALQWFANLQEAPAISVITVLELLRGCRNRREQDTIEQMTQRMPVIYLNRLTCERAVEYFRAFYLSHGIGILDSLIAATATTEGLVLCSFNTRHYQMIPDLQVVQPYIRTPQEGTQEPFQ